MGGMNLIIVLPEIFLAIVAMGFLMLGAFQGNKMTYVISWSACISLAIAAVIILNLNWVARYSFNNMVVFDEFAGAMKLLIIIGIVIENFKEEYLQIGN